ncbi:DUF4767 domain-containing protein [Pediococcus pentosaceus]|uniref:DUF4767 domain-containing protein n=1 Tax=Pediococcus pentosaceus TaxID=1255 RepID=UPI001E3331BA|nr:DUF4767 domain-containing protein [Pediococcus pentosaceus]
MKKILFSVVSLMVLVMLAACGNKMDSNKDSISKTTKSSSSAISMGFSRKNDQSKGSSSKNIKMNLSAIQNGNFSSLLNGDWKMIGAKVNYHKGNGLEFDTSQVDGQLSISRDKIVDDQLTLERRSLMVNGEEEVTKIQNNGKTLSISTENDDKANWALTFYPIGTTTEYQVDSNGGTNKQNLITVWMSNNNYTQVFAQDNPETSNTSSTTSDKKGKQSGLWNTDKDDKLESFISQWSKTMNQDYQKYDGTNELKVSTGMSYPSNLANETVKGQQASIGWSKDGKGSYEYNVVAIYNHNGTLPPLPNRITYCFAFHNGKPVVLVDQSRDGGGDFEETQNVKLNSGFNEIAKN